MNRFLGHLDLKKSSIALTKIKRRIEHGLEDLWGSLEKRHLYTQPIDRKELRVVGLKRTGNHAILKWIKSQQVGAIEHLNNVKPNENPFSHTDILRRS
jgi:hypothetical protein